MISPPLEDILYHAQHAMDHYTPRHAGDYDSSMVMPDNTVILFKTFGGTIKSHIRKAIVSRPKHKRCKNCRQRRRAS
jgi:hypothetical protein